MRQTPPIYGLLLGATLIVIAFVLQLINARLYLTMSPFIMLIVVIAFMVKSGLDERYRNEGYLSLGDAFKAVFITVAIGTTMCSIFEYVLYNFINPGLMEAAGELAIETIEKTTQIVGDFMGGEDYEKVVEEAKAEINFEDFKMTINETMMNLFFRLVWPGLICSFIIGLIVKKTNNA